MGTRRRRRCSGRVIFSAVIRLRARAEERARSMQSDGRGVAGRREEGCDPASHCPAPSSPQPGSGTPPHLACRRSATPARHCLRLPSAAQSSLTCEHHRVAGTLGPFFSFTACFLSTSSRSWKTLLSDIDPREVARFPRIPPPLCSVSQ